MKKLVCFVSLFTLLLGTAAFMPSPDSRLEGNWFGGFGASNSVVAFQVRFSTDNDEIKGTIDIPGEGISGMELSWIVVDSSSVHFEFVRDSGTLVFDGVLKGGRITGVLLTKTNRGTFDLSRTMMATQ